MALRSMLDAKEGWQAEKRTEQRVYHYIRDRFALCRGLGFYQGDFVPDVATAPKGNDDCSRCYRLLRAEQRRAAKAAPGADGGKEGDRG